MSLHYLVILEMLIAHLLPLSCYQKKLQNLFHCNGGLQIHQMWIQFVGNNITREGVQNTHHWSGPIDDVNDKWLPQWRHDLAWPTPFSVAVSVRPDQCILYTFSCNSPHM